MVIYCCPYAVQRGDLRLRNPSPCGVLSAKLSPAIRARGAMGMSPETIEWLSKNWSILSSAPWVFVALTLIAAGIGYTFGTWFKNGEIREKGWFA
jgi:hypothetical protein